MGSGSDLDKQEEAMERIAERRREEVEERDSRAIGATLEERGARYGSFSEHSRVTRGIKHAMRSGGSWHRLKDDQKEGLDMIAHKIGRIVCGDPNYHDSWHDIEGYARLISDRLTP